MPVASSPANSTNVRNTGHRSLALGLGLWALAATIAALDGVPGRLGPELTVGVGAFAFAFAVALAAVDRELRAVLAAAAPRTLALRTAQAALVVVLAAVLGTSPLVPAQDRVALLGWLALFAAPAAGAFVLAVAARVARGVRALRPRAVRASGVRPAGL
jgi:hypothetical protein